MLKQIVGFNSRDEWDIEQSELRKLRSLHGENTMAAFIHGFLLKGDKRVIGNALKSIAPQCRNFDCTIAYSLTQL